MEIVEEQRGIIYHLRRCSHQKAADEIETLNARIKELEDGSCRYNCRKRKEYCQSFAYYLYKNRQSLRPPTAQVLDDMYDDWKKDQKEWFK